MIKLIKEEAPARLNFKKYGIERDPSKDFTDDGNRFRAYVCNGVPISYTTYQGDGYLSIRVSSLGGLTYNEYSKLPSYRDCDKYNGVPISQINLADVVDICKRIKEEHDEAVGNVSEVSNEELEKEISVLIDNYNKLLKVIENRFSELGIKVLNASDWQLKYLKDYYKSLCRERDRKANFKDWKQITRRNFLNSLDYELKQASTENFYYKKIIEILSSLEQGD